MFWVQKSIIRLCNLAGKPVVTATQMLDSMITNPRPTRAEATDVANAVLDGTDCVMLSGETAAGSYPLQAVQIMSNICQEAESCVDNFALCQGLLNATLLSTPSSEPMSTIESLASSAVLTAAKVQASCIVVLASSGSAARLIAKYRPSQPVVVGVVPRERRARIGFAETRLTGHAVARQCLLTRGLIPVLVSPKSEEEAEKDPAGAAKLCVNEAVRYNAQREGDSRSPSQIQFAVARGLAAPGTPVVTLYNVEKCALRAALSHNLLTRLQAVRCHSRRHLPHAIWRVTCDCCCYATRKNVDKEMRLPGCLDPTAVGVCCRPAEASGGVRGAPYL